MGRINYPRLGRTTSKVSGLCDCCDRLAELKVDVQQDEFRGNDDVIKVCGLHAAIARQERWNALYGDRNECKARRRVSTGAALARAEGRP